MEPPAAIAGGAFVSALVCRLLSSCCARSLDQTDLICPSSTMTHSTYITRQQSMMHILKQHKMSGAKVDAR